MITVYGVYGKIELFLPTSHSLKERRRVINGVKKRLQNLFNLSVVDTSDDNVWQRATLGFALVSSGFRGLQDTLEAIDRHLGHNPDFEVIELKYEYLPTAPGEQSP